MYRHTKNCIGSGAIYQIVHHNSNKVSHLLYEYCVGKKYFYFFHFFSHKLEVASLILLTIIHFSCVQKLTRNVIWFDFPARRNLILNQSAEHPLGPRCWRPGYGTERQYLLTLQVSRYCHFGISQQSCQLVLPVFSSA